MPREPLEILPVLHAQNGDLVAPDGTPVGRDLRTVAREFKREFGAIYLVDLDGISRNKPDVALLQEVASGSPAWADAGSRFHTDVMDLMIVGAEQVTMRYATLRDREALEEAVRISENIALGMEFQDQALVQNPRWPATPPELVSIADELHLPVVVVDLDRAGKAEGIDRSVAWHARHHRPGAYLAGGVASQRDLDTLQDLGYHGALVSTALLKGADLQGKEWPGPDGEQADEENDTVPGTTPPELPGGRR